MAAFKRDENEIENTMEQNEDVSDEEGTGEDSDDMSSGGEENNERELRLMSQQLQTQVFESPYMYDNHVQLIKTLRRLGDLDKLREAREKMHEIFPLSEELWLEWLQDEGGMVTCNNEREAVTKLFERAVKDYFSVPVWLESVQFAIGGMGHTEGVQKTRTLFEQALTACGLHVSKGSDIWDAYREFENAILAGLLPAPGSVPTKEQERKFTEQHDRVQALFKRQLSVPLLGMDETYNEYKDWLQDEPDHAIQQAYKKALIKLEKIKPYEDSLDEGGVVCLDQYLEYIKYEEKEGEPARIQCLYERALQQNPLTTSLWLQYTKYLDHRLKVYSMSIHVYERAVRNCPWCVQIWQNYIITLERDHQPYDKIKGVFEAALTSGFSQGKEYLLLWTTLVDCIRRRIKWDEDHTQELEEFRRTIAKAIEQLDDLGADADPTSTLRQFWANIEAKYCQNMEKARDLWHEVMTLGHASEAALWMENYRFERCFGNSKHCRRVLQRALNSVTDWPESIVDAYINFEREEGTLEQYEVALSRCEGQLSRIQERRNMEAEAHTVKVQKKYPKKFEKKHDQKGKGKQNKPYQQNQEQEQQKQGEITQMNVQPYRRKNKPPDQAITDKAFKVPAAVPSSKKQGPPLGFKGQDKSDKCEEMESVTQTKFQVQQKSAPPPGFKRSFDKSNSTPGVESNAKATEEDEPVKKKTKTDTDDTEDSQSVANVAGRTVFISNLSFNVDEEEMKGFFSQCGEIEEVRLVKNFKGRSKGYAYIQFKDPMAVVKALTYDRSLVKNRPMYVSKYEQRSENVKSDFKYATRIEKNKLFVKNLPFSCTKEALETIFGQHGAVTSVRLVTYKSGAPKGLAYVEYMEEHDAAQAVMKTDGMQIGEHTISVAISNPPERKQPVSLRQEGSYVQSLGGGKKETAGRGVARTQVMLTPRAVTQKHVKPSVNSTQKAVAAANSSYTQTASTTTSENKSGLSNSDFRNMLLKK